MTEFQPGWYVLQTAPGREKRAESAIMELGLDVYFPRETKWVRANRQRSRAHYPLFPRYVFVHAVNGFHEIRRADAVERIIRGACGEARPIPTVWVERMRELEAGGRFDRTGKVTRELHAPGTVVKFTEEAHAFEGLMAVVMRSEPGDRVRLLFEIFGREVELVADNRDVATAQNVAA